METSFPATMSPFIYSSEKIAFSAAKRIKAAFEKRGHPPLSLGRAKQLTAACAGHQGWISLVSAVDKFTAGTMDRDLDYEALYQRRAFQSRVLAREARLPSDEAEIIVCSSEPTGFGSGYLRWYPGRDGTSIRLPKLEVGGEIDKIFTVLEEARIDDLLPVSLEWLAEELSGLKVSVLKIDGPTISVEIGSLSEEHHCSINFTYYRHMQLWLNDEETHPLRPTQIWQLYVDYRIRGVDTVGNAAQRSELGRSAAAFMMLDIWLSSFVVAERHQLDLPAVLLEVDIDRSDPAVVELGRRMSEIFSELLSIEEVDSEVTDRVPFDLITIEDIQVD